MPSWKPHCFPHLHEETLLFPLHWKSCIYPPSFICKSDVPGGPQAKPQEETCRQFCCKLSDPPYFWIKIYAQKCCGNVVCSESPAVKSAQELVWIYQATLRPSQLFVGVIEYSLPCDVSQLKRANLSVVAAMEPWLGIHKVGAEPQSSVLWNPILCSIHSLCPFLSLLSFLAARWLGKHLHDHLLGTNICF